MKRTLAAQVSRVEAMRVVGDVIRTKTDEFKLAKLAHPAAIKKAKQALIDHCQSLVTKAKTLNNNTEIGNFIGADIIVDYRKRSDFLPDEPVLNVCTEKRVLNMLKMDTRETLPIPEGHELWSIMQGQCEPKR